MYLAKNKCNTYGGVCQGGVCGGVAVKVLGGARGPAIKIAPAGLRPTVRLRGREVSAKGAKPHDGLNSQKMAGDNQKSDGHPFWFLLITLHISAIGRGETHFGQTTEAGDVASLRHVCEDAGHHQRLLVSSDPQIG